MAQNRTLFVINLTLLGAAQVICGCGPDASTLPTAIGTACLPGQLQPCQCQDGTIATKSCLANYTYPAACPCGSATSTAGSGGNGAGGVSNAGAGEAGKRSEAAGKIGAGGKPAGTGGAKAAGSGGSAGAGGKSGASAGAAGKLTTATDDLEQVRQLCVDTINQYRATENLAPLNRASAAIEACSDQGAAADGKSQVPHQSAQNGWTEFPGCSQYKGWGGTGKLQGGQNACPNWPVGGSAWTGGFATLGDAISNCLKQMWNEKTTFLASGKTREQCQSDMSATGCFMTNGHYLNMSSTGYKTVSCGFADVGNSKWWMNQDF